MQRMKGIIILLLLISIFTVGCSNGENDEKEPTQISIREALDTTLTVEVYSDGKCSELLTTSEEFKQISTIVVDNDGKAHGIDGGWAVDMSGSIDYTTYSLDEGYKTYIINFKEPLNLKYSDYTSSGNTVIGMFVVPEQGYIGMIYKVDADSEIGYATLMNLEEDIFEEVK